MADLVSIETIAHRLRLMICAELAMTSGEISPLEVLDELGKD